MASQFQLRRHSACDHDCRSRQRKLPFCLGKRGLSQWLMTVGSLRIRIANIAKTADGNLVTGRHPVFS